MTSRYPDVQFPDSPRTDPETRATVIRYQNLVGAIVAVTRRGSADPGSAYRHQATCGGCLEESLKDQSLRVARQWASDHAAQCRALPQPGEQAEDVTVYLADGRTWTFKGVTRESAAGIELTLGSSPHIARIDVEPAS